MKFSFSTNLLLGYILCLFPVNYFAGKYLNTDGMVFFCISAALFGILLKTLLMELENALNAHVVAGAPECVPVAAVRQQMDRCVSPDFHDNLHRHKIHKKAQKDLPLDVMARARFEANLRALNVQPALNAQPAMNPPQKVCPQETPSLHPQAPQTPSSSPKAVIPVQPVPSHACETAGHYVAPTGEPQNTMKK